MAVDAQAAEVNGVSFTVPGEPQAKGRAKIVKIAGFSRMATPAKTVAYEGLVAHSAQQAMAGTDPIECACQVQMTITVGVPASWSKRKQAAAISGHVLPTKKPDVDNVVKAIFDGINGVVWRDDVQAVDLFVRKRYGTLPGVQVRVTQCGDAA